MQRLASSTSLPGRGAPARGAILGMFALLAGCQGEVTMDLGTELPADPDISQVVANVRGLEFTTGGSGTETLEFNDSEQVEFIDLAADNGLLRMFTSEELPEGNYTGVRLLFDEDRLDDAFVSLSNGTQFPLNIADGNYASLTFNVEDNKSSKESFTLSLDLRKSLRFDNDTNEYTLTPAMRAANTEDMGRIDGLVSTTCSAGGELGTGAVYLYQGRDIVPDDIDGSGVEPFATSPIFIGQGNSFFYALRYLPPGDYTASVTCSGNEEDPAADDDLEFRGTVNVNVDDGESVTLDLR